MVLNDVENTVALFRDKCNILQRVVSLYETYMTCISHSLLCLWLVLRWLVNNLKLQM